MEVPKPEQQGEKVDDWKVRLLQKLYNAISDRLEAKNSEENKIILIRVYCPISSNIADEN